MLLLMLLLVLTMLLRILEKMVVLILLLLRESTRSISRRSIKRVHHGILFTFTVWKALILVM